MKNDTENKPPNLNPSSPPLRDGKKSTGSIYECWDASESDETINGLRCWQWDEGFCPRDARGEMCRWLHLPPNW